MSDSLKEREAFEAWAQPILGDNPTWRESGPCELAWQAWNRRAAIEADRVSRDVHAGWKLVPVEPTDEMILAFAQKECPADNSLTQDIRMLYSAMLAASPQPQAKRGEVAWLDDWSPSPQPQPVQASQYGSPELQSLILEKLAQPVQAQPSEVVSVALAAAKKGPAWDSFCSVYESLIGREITIREIAWRCFLSGAQTKPANQQKD